MNHKFLIYISFFLILSLSIGFLPSFSQPVDALIADTALVSSVITALAAGAAGTGLVSIIINTLKLSSNSVIQNFRDHFWSDGSVGAGIDYYAVDTDEQTLILNAIEAALQINDGYHQINSNTYLTLSYAQSYNTSVTYNSSNSKHHLIVNSSYDWNYNNKAVYYDSYTYANTTLDYLNSPQTANSWYCTGTFPNLYFKLSKSLWTTSNYLTINSCSAFTVNRPGTYTYSSGNTVTVYGNDSNMSESGAYSSMSDVTATVGDVIFFTRQLYRISYREFSINFPKTVLSYQPLSSEYYSLLPTGYSAGDGTFTMGDDDGSGLQYTFIDPSGNTWDYYDDFIKLKIGSGGIDSLGEDADLLDGYTPNDEGDYVIDYLNYENGHAIDWDPSDDWPDVTWPDTDDNTTTPDIDVPTYPDVESEWPQVIDPTTIDDITDIDELPIIDPLDPDGDSLSFSWDGFWEKFNWISQLKVIITDLTDFSSPDDTPSLVLHFGNSTSEYFNNSGDIVALDLSWYAPYRTYVNKLVGGVLWFFFFLHLFRQAPAILGGAAISGWTDDYGIFLKRKENDK